jgi:outer membrane protein OmpA-like peptidoglycan-associated protein
MVEEKQMDFRNSRFVSLVLVSACLALLPMGCKKAPPITLTAEAAPPAIFPGEPVTVTATAGSVDPNKKNTVVYGWTGTGVTGNGASATVATATLAPGSYTVQAQVKEGKPGKEGLKPGQKAEASASFTVKPFEPPTISCSVSPTVIKPGESATVTAVGVSPQNRPLTYSYSAAAGAVSGTGTTAEFNSTGAPVGPVAINCNVADDKGGTATASTSVTIAAPYVAPAPHAQALCSITFEKDPKRPDRVDNDAKACLDEVALDLQKQSDATVVVVGDSTAAEKTPKTGHKHAKSEDFAGQRAVNTKDYLVTEKGIDASRITVKTGGTDAQEVQNYLVPSGADFATDVTGTTAVDETAVKPQTRKALSARPELKHKKAAEPPAAQ